MRMKRQGDLNAAAFVLAILAAMAVIVAAPKPAWPGEAGPGLAAELPEDVREWLRPSGSLRSVEIEDPGLRIAGPTRFEAGERAVPRPAREGEARAVGLAELEASLVEPDLESRAAELRRCRAEVALTARIAPDEVRAGELLVRWTLAPDGRAEDTAVVAMGPTDPRVLDCVHDKVERWTFDRLPGDRLQVSLPLRFDAGSPAARAPRDR